jgi:hypothetical protein
MIEALVGVLFAACFVTIYFIIALLRGRGEPDGKRWQELYPPALQGANLVDPKQKLFKTTDEMSRHQLPASGATSPKMMKAGTDQAGQGQHGGTGRA